MTIASFAATLRVRLLSTAQHRHAPTISNAPTGTPPYPASTTAACRRRRSRPFRGTPANPRSRETRPAMTAVSTPSRLSSNALVAAGVLDSPSISKAGPATPPAAIAPASQGRSARCSGAAAPVVACRLCRRRSRIPRPGSDAAAEIEQTGDHERRHCTDQRLGERCRGAEQRGSGERDENRGMSRVHDPVRIDVERRWSSQRWAVACTFRNASCIAAGQLARDLTTSARLSRVIMSR